MRWTSGGTGDFEVETIERAARGTTITLHIRDDKTEFLSHWKLKSLISKYSDHISLPILMRKEEWDAEKSEYVQQDEWEAVNSANALWARSKKDITDEQYAEFYKNLSYDQEAPLAWSHNRVEGSTEYTQLLYIPAKAPGDLWNRDRKAGIKLYVKRVFIMDEAESLMPSYLRWVKGVVDSADLPLNVSRLGRSATGGQTIPLTAAMATTSSILAAGNDSVEGGVGNDTIYGDARQRHPVGRRGQGRLPRRRAGNDIFRVWGATHADNLLWRQRHRPWPISAATPVRAASSSTWQR